MIRIWHRIPFAVRLLVVLGPVVWLTAESLLAVGVPALGAAVAAFMAALTVGTPMADREDSRTTDRTAQEG